MLGAQMGFVNSDESKRFSCVADEECIENHGGRGQFLGRGKYEEGGFGIISDGMNARDNLVVNRRRRQFVQVHRLD